MDFFNIFEIGIGLYLLYAAITGKGRYYDNEYCKVPREQYVKVMRIFAWIVGILIMVAPVLQLTGLMAETSVWGWILWLINMIGIAGMLVANVKMTDRQKAKAAQSAGTSSAAKGKDLSAAFEFDDEDDKKNE
ncbi:MAG: hypothetical protein Q4E65_00610 [Clostridia bacterium]|nr:hypothetical protein [Clostridia bacterium]